MTGVFPIDWAVMAVSLFNTVLMPWLGLTVLLNAERRTWGVWLASGGLLMGGAFFLSHSAILGHGPDLFGRGMDFWWRVGWLPVVTTPFAWYMAMLWYGGFWEDRQSPLHRRQRPWFLIAILLAVGSAGLLIFANPLPSFWQAAQLDLSATPSLGDIPLSILIYPPYILLCIALSLDALRRPGPTARVMGDLARRRARPWLVGASIALLAVSLLVTGIVLWVVLNARQRVLYSAIGDMALTVAWFDLIIAGLIAVAVILVGKAVVSYEVFTGKALPRRGFFRHWRSAVILAAGYGAVVGWSLTLQLRLVYSLLLTAMTMTVFYALFSWRSYAERERTMDHLRPFVASQQLVERLLAPSAPPDVDAVTPFRALCEDVLGTRVAYLVALGPLAPLAGPPLTHPGSSTATTLPPLHAIVARLDSPQTMCVPLDPSRYGGATWAVPLWSERGLIGVLLLGEKQDGGLYTQEEIEIARASGERLIDTQASATMARRLMALQRQRLTESQVLDQRARRALHDDVLPALHAATLSLGGDGASSETISLLVDAHRQISDLLHELPTPAATEVTRLGLVGALRRLMDDEMESAFDSVAWQIEPAAERTAESIPPLTAEVLFYAAREAIRNAARHGRHSDAERRLNLRLAIAQRDGLEITVEDDGVGIGTTTRSGQGGGQGLALHSTMMAVVGGTLAVESAPDAYTRVTLRLPQAAW